MPLYDPSVPSRYVRPILTLLDAHGTQLRKRVLAEAGIDRAALLADNGALSFRHLDQLLCCAARELDRSDLGFELGRHITIDDHAALGPVLRQCESADSLLRTVARYQALVTNGLFFNYVRGSHYVEMIIRPAAAMSSPALYMLQELLAVSFQQDLTALIGRLHDTDILLSIPAPAHVRRYRELRPTRFSFAANALPEVRCRLPLALADQALVHPADAPDRTNAGLPLVQPRGTRSREYREWVAMILREADGVQPSLPDLARMLNISPRSLTRFLQAEGTSLRQLGTDIRIERARRLLAGSDEAVSQIGYRLGYGSPVSFFTAFRNGTGVSPSQFRHQARRTGL